MSEEQKAALQRDYIRKNHPHWFPFGGSQCALCVIMDELDELITERNGYADLCQELNAELTELRELKPEPVTDLPKPKKKRAKK